MFIWEKSVERIEWTTVYFTSGEQKEYTEKALQYIVTDELQDPTAYRNIILDNVMPEVKALIVGDDIVKIVWYIMKLLEDHDLTNAEVQNIIDRLLSEIAKDHNDYIEEHLGDVIAKFKLETEKYKEVKAVLTDSYEQGLFLDIGKAFGTYKEWEPASYFLDNIRISDLRNKII